MTAEQISRYPVVRALGSGGMGEVYLARDPELDRDIALKVLRADSDADRDEAVGRLRDEARAVAALRHPNIVTVYEIGADGDRAFIAMEYIDGDSLRAHFDAGMATGELLEVGARVARALEAAHAAGVLHRDIKPDNVMLDRLGAVKVVDFGIAHRLDGGRDTVPASPRARVDAIANTIADTLPQSSPEVTAQTIFGTPAYMAPEVVCGQPPLPTSDVYALGVTLYEGLAGRLPYAAGNVLEALTRVADPAIPFEPLAASRPDLAPEIVAVIESMLAHEPFDRPTAGDVAERLEALCAPSTEPVEVIRTITKEQRRSRAPWLVAAAGVAIAAVAMVALALSRDRSPEPGAAPAGANRLAVTPIDGDYSSLGHASIQPADAGKVLARALASADGIEPVLLDPAAGAPADAARAEGAALLLSSSIEIDKGRVRARFAIVGLDDGETRRGEVESRTVAGAISELARAALVELGAEPSEQWKNTTARVSFELGLAAYRREAWPSAQLFLEQAIEAQPDLPSAWFYLAWVRGWVGAPAESTQEAARRAAETARTDLERGLGKAIGLFINQRYRQAAAALEPLLESNPQDRDLLYTYAEALYHDGQIERAMVYFNRCLEVAPQFLPASRHPRQVAVARKDTAGFRRFQIAAGAPYEAMVAYLGGDDRAAAAAGFKAETLRLVAGNYGPSDRAYAERRDAEALAYVVGRAVQLGTRAAARARFAVLWPEIAAAAEEPKGAFGLQILGRALVIGGYDREVAVVQRWWDAHQAPVNLMARQELSVFATPLLDTRLPPRDQLTTRLGRAADGIAALRAGRTAEAADILGALAAAPDGRAGDYLIWHAWARALRAAGRTDELRAACHSWQRPGFFDLSIVALWAYCDQALR